MPDNRAPEFGYWLFDQLDASRRRIGLDPIYLGGAQGAGGGVGSPPGGFIGQLRQANGAYDTDEFSELSTGSAPSILDNLNHIRGRLSTVAKFWNRSSGSLFEGDVVVVVYTHPESFGVTTEQGSLEVCGVVRSPVVSSGSSGFITLDGYARKIKLTSSGSPGDYIRLSASASYAEEFSSGSASPTAIGVITSSGSLPSGILFGGHRRAMGGVSREIVLYSADIDLKSVAEYTINPPAGTHYYLDEIGVICTSATSISTQPTVRFGIVGTLAKHHAAAITTLLTAANKRDKFTPLVPQDGETNVTFGVTVGASATTMRGRAYWRGVVLED